MHQVTVEWLISSYGQLNKNISMSVAVD
jgi:hypothetical protein